MRSKAFLLTLIWVVFACSLSDVKTNAYSGAAGVRMVHALVDVESADIYLNDTLIGTVAYGGAAPYMRLNAGDVTVRAFAPGTGPDGVPVFEENFVISDGQHVNVALIGTALESRLGVYAIDLTPMGDNFGVSHVNLIHAVAGGDPMMVTATDRDGSVTTLVENLAFGASVAFDLPAGSYLLNAGDILQDVALNGNGDMTFAVFVIGAADGSQPVATRVFTNSTLDDTPVGHPRFVHAIPDGEAVDIYLNDTLVSTQFNFGRVSAYFGLPVGTYVAKLYTAGDDPASATPLYEGDLEINDGVYQTVVVMSGVEGLTLAALTDDMSAPPERSSGVAVVNALPDAVSFQIDGIDAVIDLASGTISERITLPEGAHDFLAGETTLEGFSMSPVTIANLKTIIVTGTDFIILTDCPVE